CLNPFARDWGCGSQMQLTVGARDVRPVDRRHEGIDIGNRLRSVIDVIRVLVHIERQYWAAAGERRRMVQGPLIDELAVARRPGAEAEGSWTFDARDVMLRQSHAIGRAACGWWGY